MPNETPIVCDHSRIYPSISCECTAAAVAYLCADNLLIMAIAHALVVFTVRRSKITIVGSATAILPFRTRVFLLFPQIHLNLNCLAAGASTHMYFNRLPDTSRLASPPFRLDRGMITA